MPVPGVTASATSDDLRMKSSPLTSIFQGIPKQELIDVDLGEHFHLEIIFDPTKFEFRIKYNGGEMEPYVVPTADYYFSNATLDGDLEILYMGFPFLGFKYLSHLQNQNMI